MTTKNTFLQLLNVRPKTLIMENKFLEIKLFKIRMQLVALDLKDFDESPSNECDDN